MLSKGSIKDVTRNGNIFPVEVFKSLKETERRPAFTLIDVSTPREFRTAHLENALNINYFSRLFKSRLRTLSRDRTYVVYCRMGGRSKLAQRAMNELGFKDVYNLVGGTLLWEEEGLPFATGRGPNKWTLCPVSNTIVIFRVLKKHLRPIYDTFPALVRTLRALLRNNVESVSGCSLSTEERR